MAVREPLDVEEPWCGMPTWVCIVGHSAYQDCCHWPKSTGWKTLGCFVMGCETVRKKICSLKESE